MTRYQCQRCQKDLFTTDPGHLCKDVQARLTAYRQQRRSYLLRLLRGKRCPKHGTVFQVVCGVKKCGMCYEQWLLTAPDRNRLTQRVVGEVVWTPHKFAGYGRNTDAKG